MSKPLFMKEVIGSPGDPYLTRYTFWRFSLHIMHRGDKDPASHDHPKGFWTLPLVGYLEDALYEAPGAVCRRLSVVKAFHFYRREATYRHRIIEPIEYLNNYGTGRFPILTLVFWDKQNVREWGFWPMINGRFTFVPWRTYLGLDQ